MVPPDTQPKSGKNGNVDHPSQLCLRDYPWHSCHEAFHTIRHPLLRVREGGLRGRRPSRRDFNRRPARAGSVSALMGKRPHAGKPTHATTSTHTGINLLHRRFQPLHGTLRATNPHGKEQTAWRRRISRSPRSTRSISPASSPPSAASSKARGGSSDRKS